MKNRGFTLIETLIYIALFGVLMSGAVVSSYQLLQGGQRHQQNVSVQEEGTFINRKINWALSGATGASVSGGGTLLTIIRPDLGSESPLVIDGSGTVMTLKRGSAAPLPLSTGAFAMRDVVFATDPAANGKPRAVRANFTLENRSFFFGTYLRQ